MFRVIIGVNNFVKRFAILLILISIYITFVLTNRNDMASNRSTHLLANHAYTSMVFEPCLSDSDCRKHYEQHVNLNSDFILYYHNYSSDEYVWPTLFNVSKDEYFHPKKDNISIKEKLYMVIFTWNTETMLKETAWKQFQTRMDKNALAYYKATKDLPKSYNEGLGKCKKDTNCRNELVNSHSIQEKIQVLAKYKLFDGNYVFAPKYLN